EALANIITVINRSSFRSPAKRTTRFSTEVAVVIPVTPLSSLPHETMEALLPSPPQPAQQAAARSTKLRISTDDFSLEAPLTIDSATPSDSSVKRPFWSTKPSPLFNPTARPVVDSVTL